MDDILPSPLSPPAAATATWENRGSGTGLGIPLDGDLRARLQGRELSPTSKGTAAEERLEYVEGVALPPAATHPFLDRVLSILIVYLALFRVTQDLIGLSQLLELRGKQSTDSISVVQPEQCTQFSGPCDRRDAGKKRWDEEHGKQDKIRSTNTHSQGLREKHLRRIENRPDDRKRKV